MGARSLWLYPDLIIPPDEPSPDPRDHTEIYEQITGRVIGHWNPKAETVEALSALLERLLAETEHGPDMDRLPTIGFLLDLDPYVYVADHRGMCLVVSDLEPIVHVTKLRRQVGKV
ncbi:hypothetical protein KXR53_21080 [Inquilinus limosus]|uniref:hypothetical protein n=1 Tax=Inquilinus limosus TaxID=171674 RepID=UPI003F15C82D